MHKSGEGGHIPRCRRSSPLSLSLYKLTYGYCHVRNMITHWLSERSQRLYVSSIVLVYVWVRQIRCGGWKQHKTGKKKTLACPTYFSETSASLVGITASHKTLDWFILFSPSQVSHQHENEAVQAVVCGYYKKICVHIIKIQSLFLSLSLMIQLFCTSQNCSSKTKEKKTPTLFFVPYVPAPLDNQISMHVKKKKNSLYTPLMHINNQISKGMSR